MHLTIGVIGKTLGIIELFLQLCTCILQSMVPEIKRQRRVPEDASRMQSFTTPFGKKPCKKGCQSRNTASSLSLPLSLLIVCGGHI